MRCGHMYPSDLRLPWWLASNSLHFGTGLHGFLIHVYGRLLGVVKYLLKSVSSQDGIGHSKKIGEMLDELNLAKPRPG